MTPEFVFSRMPEDIIKNSPTFTNFIQAYYKWGQEQGYSLIINNYRSLLNQQLYSKNYEDRMVKNFGVDVNIIEDTNIRTELLYKLLNEFLETRGTKTSFEILFRMMFNEQVEIKYPRDELFRPSSSKYLQTSLILMTGTFPLSISSHLRGMRSNTSTGIESITPYYIGNIRYYLVECSNIYDQFILGEPIQVSTLDYSYSESHIPLVNVKINATGTRYKVGDKITPSNNKFSGILEVKSVTKGSIDSVLIDNAGTGYKVGDKIRTTELSHFDAYVSEIGVGGEIVNIKIRNKGYNFTDIPDYVIMSDDGVDAEITLSSLTIGNVREIGPTSGSIIFDTSSITYSIDSDNGNGLSISSQAVSCYYLNRYKNKVGFLSSKSTIIDSYTKHSHSYDIISEVPVIKYDSAVAKYANPSGYIYNRIYSTDNNITLSDIEVLGEIIRE